MVVKHDNKARSGLNNTKHALQVVGRLWKKVEGEWDRYWAGLCSPRMSGIPSWGLCKFSLCLLLKQPPQIWFSLRTLHKTDAWMFRGQTGQKCRHYVQDRLLDRQPNTNRRLYPSFLPYFSSRSTNVKQESEEIGAMSSCSPSSWLFSSLFASYPPEPSGSLYKKPCWGTSLRWVILFTYQKIPNRYCVTASLYVSSDR